jgi:hypothetical protein
MATSTQVDVALLIVADTVHEAFASPLLDLLRLPPVIITPRCTARLRGWLPRGRVVLAVRSGRALEAIAPALAPCLAAAASVEVYRLDVAEGEVGPGGEQPRSLHQDPAGAARLPSA